MHDVFLNEVVTQSEMKERKENTGSDIITFANGQRLLTDLTPGKETLRLLTTEGKVQMTIRIKKDGSEISLSGDIVKIAAKEKLELESPVINLTATKEICLTSDGDMHQTVKRDSYQKARIHNIIADLGNVNIKANDDVKLDGERVKLNCTD